MPKVEIFETKDGSHSLLLTDMNETYHSTHGAMTEAQYVFLSKGLDHCRKLFPDKEVIKILEIGFGTGLNAWLTACKVQGESYEVEFASLEKHPLSKEIIDQLNYTDRMGTVDAKELYDKVHQADWDQLVRISTAFSLHKMEGDILNLPLAEGYFDLIYFDAFAPSKQPEMWSQDILKRMFAALVKGGVLVTYCAQGQFKRDLKTVGFETEELPGPPGKKEMTRAVKP
ncbi:tRNA (5-methylaminomethyl-2-thiouridine)(34)-methyltransferase MnmD [Reichenbachiella agarivorans]|uniref:tRNA (5-methylaminomethyl-2-thiouridine)(34)-methyltransferase MnmD n=1 Tax=Reichenbachiella agarivorans TaxID=2979464 RepID=A0ABY6CS11_9BACT|nr:tRNA (5-methylaminomethyl-2-thiouridine)(34)-methyltransferase MnmD [Reichenbachiella agarivorans]UXP33311.1 tRNA (5-methylaminomethyl-2-thiouridine)(34)-methyltransferase MnmD [Reichenbachiella agarivorans]